MGSRARNFVIIYQANEGTSALVRLLHNFSGVSIVQQVNNIAWEPFDRYQCGPMRLPNLVKCFDLLLGPAPVDIERVNSVYTASAPRALAEVGAGDAVGMKIRFAPPLPAPFWIPRGGPLNRITERLAGPRARSDFRAAMFELFARTGTVVFFAVRQDLLRWALSKYHGDGSCQPGHMQFELAAGRISRDDVRPFHVDCDRLEQLIRNCEHLHAEKRALADALTAAGVDVHVLNYEDFLVDKETYFRRLFACLGRDLADGEVAAAIAAGSYFEKVHSDDVADFVENHIEVTGRFSDRFDAWP